MDETDSITFAAGARAFGDGNHPTTTLMLAAIESLDPAKFTPGIACDMGCGSGILSLALAKKFGCKVVAVDVLRESVETTRMNALHNKFSVEAPLPQAGEGARAASGEGIIIPVHSDGFRHADVRAHAPYDLIVMNILAEPLLALAADAQTMLADQGVLLISGIFAWQEAQLTQAYQSLGLERTQQLTRGEWLAQVWQKP